MPVAVEDKANSVYKMQRQLFARSERVKGIDFHPVEPWILTTLYSGHVYIWSYETQVCASFLDKIGGLVWKGRSRG
jgi:hypothetical protein